MEIDYRELAHCVNQLFDGGTEECDAIEAMLQDPSNVAWLAACQEYVARDFDDSDVFEGTMALKRVMDELDDVESLDDSEVILNVSEKMALLATLWMPKLVMTLLRVQFTSMGEDNLDCITNLFMELYVARTNVLMACGVMDRMDPVERRTGAATMFNRLQQCYFEDHGEDPRTWLQNCYTNLLQEASLFAARLEALNSADNPWALVGLSGISDYYSRAVVVAKQYDALMLHILLSFSHAVNRAL